jgi:replicative DNA helicase
MARGEAFDRAINEAMVKLSEYVPPESSGQKPIKLWIDDTPAISIQQLTTKCRYAVEQLGVKVIVIDYAQLITSSSDKAKRNRLEEVSEVSRGLKAIARAFKVKLIVAAQLNRDVDDRPGHVPLLSDMRECGQLEQDADVVLAPVRPGYYAKTDAQKAKLMERIGQVPNDSGGWRDCDKDDAAKYAELHILKQRAGSTGHAKCWYHGEQCWFEGWTKELYSNNPAKRQANAADNSGPKHGEGSGEA